MQEPNFGKERISRLVLITGSFKPTLPDSDLTLFGVLILPPQYAGY
jgi:hypothetical protein